MASRARVIRGRGLSAGYGQRTVLDGLTFDLPVGRTSAVVGPGGSGKSTLLRVLSGEQGEAAPWRRGRLIRPRVSARCLPQKPPPAKRSLAELLESETADPARWLGQLWRCAPPAAAALKAQLRTPLSAMSSKLRRLAELTAVVGADADGLFLDEPETGASGEPLDWMALKINELRGKRTIVLVTHNLAFARAVADYVLLLVDGKIIEAAEAQQFFERPVHPRTQHFVRMGC